MYVIPLLYMYESFFLRHVRVARAYPHNEEIKYMKKQKKIFIPNTTRKLNPFAGVFLGYLLFTISK